MQCAGKVSTFLQPGQQGVQREHLFLTRTSSCLSFPLSFHCLAAPLPFLSLILPVVVLNWCQEGFGVGGGRTLTIKPSCCISTGARRGGGDGGEKEENLELLFDEHYSKILDTNGAKISSSALKSNLTHSPVWLSVSSLFHLRSVLRCTCNLTQQWRHRILEKSLHH